MLQDKLWYLKIMKLFVNVTKKLNELKRTKITKITIKELTTLEKVLQIAN